MCFLWPLKYSAIYWIYLYLLDLFIFIGSYFLFYSFLDLMGHYICVSF